jgi:hypothetical protein
MAHKATKKTRILVVMEGGLIRAVRVDNRSVQVLIMDYDDFESASELDEICGVSEYCPDTVGRKLLTDALRQIEADTEDARKKFSAYA